MARVTEPPRVVAKLMAERADGTVAAVVFLGFAGEDEGEAMPFELTKDRLGQVRLVPCEGKLADWRTVAVMAAEMGG